jgi:hypothetical protein
MIAFFSTDILLLSTGTNRGTLQTKKKLERSFIYKWKAVEYDKVGTLSYLLAR